MSNLRVSTLESLGSGDVFELDKLGYTFEYAAGVTVSSNSQIIKDGGLLYRASGSTPLPYTTTGLGMPESGAFVVVGDGAALRQELDGALNDGQGALNVRGSVIYVDTIADLQALPTSELVDGQAVQVNEYHASSRAGGGEFYWDADSSEEDNGGTVFAPSGAATGRWIRRHDGAVNVTWFGAKGDGASDDTESIQRAIDYCSNLYNFPEIKSVNNFGGNDVTTYQPVFLEGGSGLFCISAPLIIRRVNGLTVRDMHLKAIGDTDFEYMLDISKDSDVLAVQDLMISRLKLECQFKVNTGIHIDDGLFISISQCVINNFVANGIYVKQESHDVIIDGCNIGFAKHADPTEGRENSTGIRLEANDNIVTSNIIYSAGVGIYVDKLSAGNEFASNHIYGIRKAAMEIVGPRNKLVNNFFDSGWGILLKGFQQTTITNNTFLMNNNAADTFFIKLAPQGLNQAFYGITIVDNLFNNFASGGQVNIKVDEADGTFDYSATHTVNIFRNFGRNTPLTQTREKRVVDVDDSDAVVVTFLSLALGEISYVDFSVSQLFATLPPAACVIAGVSTNPPRVELRFSKPITGKVYIEAFSSTP